MSEEMAVQGLGMQVSLGAVRTRELSIGILLGNLALGLSRSGSGSCGPAWGAGKDASTALRADHTSGCSPSGIMEVWGISAL